MEFKNCTIYLIGFQGVGKLSIAREICKRTDFRLIDNHAINNLVFPFVRVDGRGIRTPEIWAVTRRIREIVLETMVSLGNRDFNFVFTNVLLEGQENDLGVYESLEKAVRDRDGCFIPVQIVCQEEEHRKRLSDPAREVALKQTDVAVVSGLHRDKLPLKPTHAHAITLDVTSLSAAEAAESILRRAEETYRGWMAT